MISLPKALSDYLAMRRALGFQLYDTERCLRQFVHFAQTAGAAFITTELALRWASQPTRALPAHRARRLGMVRQFAHSCHALDTRTEIPPVGLLPYRYRRKTPYLYRDEELERLLQAARQLPSPTGLRAATYTTLLGLLIVTGMRISEPIARDRTDVDLDCGALTIHGTKVAKSRWLPLHPTTGQALQRYAALRDRLPPEPTTPSFFLAEAGTRLTVNTVEQTFVTWSQRIGLRQPGDRFGPRLHDLRHRFALQTLLGWYRAGLDVEPRLPPLAAYLGHAHSNDPFWYISAPPELLRLAAARVVPPRAEGWSPCSTPQPIYPACCKRSLPNDSSANVKPARIRWPATVTRFAYCYALLNSAAKKPRLRCRCRLSTLR